MHKLASETGLTGSVWRHIAFPHCRSVERDETALSPEAGPQTKPRAPGRRDDKTSVGRRSHWFLRRTKDIFLSAIVSLSRPRHTGGQPDILCTSPSLNSPFFSFSSTSVLIHPTGISPFVDIALNFSYTTFHRRKLTFNPQFDRFYEAIILYTIYNKDNSEQ